MLNSVKKLKNMTDAELREYVKIILDVHEGKYPGRTNPLVPFITEICEEARMPYSFNFGEQIIQDEVCERFLKNDQSKVITFLQKVANWELPSTGTFWDPRDRTQPISYEAAHGSNGVRDYFKDLARKLLNEIK
jgi:hypothetical protein